MGASVCMSLGIGACDAFRKSLSSCAKMWFLTIIADHKDVMFMSCFLAEVLSLAPPVQ